MPRLILKFDDRMLSEYPLGSDLTIGRLPDNGLVIDNPAVSGHHARVFLDGDHYVVEDLRSKNGTYVNEKHALRATLQNGDVLLIGKHNLVFDETDAAESSSPRPFQPSLERTAYLDTKSHRERLARLREERKQADELAKLAADGVAILRVLAGRTDRWEYALEARTSFIGKSEVAVVRLRGWFKPKAAAAIVRSDEGYVLTVLRGRTLVNHRRLTGSRDLKDGDILEVGGLTLEFCMSGASREASPPESHRAEELAC